ETGRGRARQEPAQFRARPIMGRVAGEVVPLVGIAGVIVELFAAVLVMDQAPAVVANAVVPVVERRHHGPGFAVRVAQKRPEALTVEIGERRQPAELVERRKEVDEAHGPVAERGLADCGRGRGGWSNYKRNTRGPFPAGPLAPVLLLSQVPAVIAP